MRRLFRYALLIGALALPSHGCAAAVPIVKTVLDVIDQVSPWVDLIDAVAGRHLQALPDSPEKRAAEVALIELRSAIVLARESGQAHQALAEGRNSDAVRSVETAYEAAIRALKAAGVEVAYAGGDGRAGAAPGGVRVPTFGQLARSAPARGSRP